jgi:hypothetical protein
MRPTEASQYKKLSIAGKAHYNADLAAEAATYPKNGPTQYPQTLAKLMNGYYDNM